MEIEELFTLDRLNDAFYQSKKISHWKEATQRYNSNLLLNNLELRDELLNGTYRVSSTTNFVLNERGKERNIEAPSQRDRVVQKVLCKQILIPQLTKYLIYDNYASLENRGTSFARKRINVLLRKFIDKYGTGYVLKVDIRKYFESIDHEILKTMVHSKIHESKKIMDLIDYVIDSSSHSEKGLNLGSEAPQILAIFYLSPVDNYIKNVLGVKYYGRYMDDIFIFSQSKEELKNILNQIKVQLGYLKLEINDKKTSIIKLSHGFTYMQIQYSVDNGKIIKRPTRAKIVRERRRLKKFKKLYDKKLLTELEIRNCYKSWRNNIIKDCNCCYRSITKMDMLYESLFPIVEEKIIKSRDEIINEFIEKEKDYEIYCSCGC